MVANDRSGNGQSGNDLPDTARSATGRSGRSSEEIDIDELLEAVAELDAMNEHLRLKVLDLMRLMEDAVTAQVRAERQRDELRAQLDRVEAELDAIGATRLMRWSAAPRRWYQRARGRA
jgi:hypothetical protein